MLLLLTRHITLLHMLYMYIQMYPGSRFRFLDGKPHDSPAAGPPHRRSKRTRLSSHLEGPNSPCQTLKAPEAVLASKEWVCHGIQVAVHELRVCCARITIQGRELLECPAAAAGSSEAAHQQLHSSKAHSTEMRVRLNHVRTSMLCSMLYE
jgi:hypothetical protein